VATETIPTHDFTKDDASSIFLKVEKLEPLAEYNPNEPHRHNFYEIFYFAEGGGVHLIDFETIPIISNSIHFVSPGQVHFVNRELKSTGFVIMFSREFFYARASSQDLLFEMPFFHTSASQSYLDLNKPDSVLDIVVAIQKEYEIKGMFKPEILCSYVNILLFKCKDIYDKEHARKGDKYIDQHVNRFRILIEQKFAAVHKVLDYAALLNISANHLNDLCKNAIGKNAAELIHDRLILESKRLLLHSELSAKEIAYFLNFEDPSYFGRFFGAHVGMAPNAFRKAIREKYQN
jgi:AraC family transcriptional activator of pobA